MVDEQVFPNEDDKIEDFIAKNEDQYFQPYDPVGNGYALSDPKGWYLNGGNELG